MLIWPEQGGETSRRKAVFTAKRGATGAHESHMVKDSVFPKQVL